MKVLFLLTLFVVAIVLLYWATRLILAGMAWYRSRGARLVVCPETKAHASVHLDRTRAAASVLLGAPELRLCECSRWPERGQCGQPCLKQIESAPDGCLVKAMVERFYDGKSCALCHHPFESLDWYEHQPALMDERGRSVRWADVPAELLPHFLETYRPICWNCHVAETFRREHPQLVIERNYR
jgi:hypothetical protein